ncbi:hypothetical protein OESDEN_06526 [Oesophagostomum dentatum]|uniref:Uncharacterized protein n=1 Tax=Oesophagostomum dentatum TaxID=61180 RepID=A0A0B1TBQ6_OESDE|nr:hypothetical protein OESDEN_06526 [Oesophagostomum dentatum]
MKKKETKSPKINEETIEVTKGFDSLDGGTKALLIGGACLFSLLILYCLYRICCYISDPTDEAYLQHMKKAPSSVSTN